MKQLKNTKPALLLMLLLSGCSILGSKTPPTIYAPDPHVVADPSWPTVKWQLALAHPDAARMVDTLRIAVRPTPGELEVYQDASWAKTPSEQIESTILRTLEDSGKIAAVARQGSGIAADYTLLTEVRRFESDYAGNAVPAATIEVTAKLLHATDQDIVASQTFLETVPASGTSTAAVAQAFGTALGAITHDIAGWTLTTGNAREQKGHRSAK
ncbi:MAG: ABC-type transport auxiliary lipoprotein family protein [Luteimonas sp.]